MLTFLFCLQIILHHQTGNQSVIHDFSLPVKGQDYRKARDDSTCIIEEPPKPNSGVIRVYPYEIKQTTQWETTDSGIQTKDKGKSASITFSGTRVYITAYAPDTSISGRMDVYIDDDHFCTLDLSNDELYFDSGEMFFGKHTIEVKHNSANTDDQYIALRYFEYRPHFTYSNLHFQVIHFHPYSGIIGSLSNFSYLEISSGPTAHTFNCTRFWITGIRHKQQTSFSIHHNITGISSPISKTLPAPEPNCSYYSILAYESPVFPLQNVEIKLFSFDGAKLSALFYCQQPYNWEVIYPKDMEQVQTSTNSDGVVLIGQSSPEAPSYVNFSYYGRDFVYIGAYDTNSPSSYEIFHNEISLGKFSAHLYNHPVITIKNSYFAPLYSSARYDLITHTLRIQVTQQYQLYCYYAFYTSDPDKLPERVDSILATEFIESEDSSFTFGYTGYDFWLEARVGPFQCKVKVTYDENTDHAQEHEVSLYKEEYNTAIFYNSNGLQLTNHTVKITNTNCNRLRLSKAYYVPIDPTFTFSVSSIFTNSLSFTLSSAFSFSDYFSFSTEFTKSAEFTNHPESAAGKKLPKYFSLMIGVICGTFAILVIVVILIVIHNRRQKAKEEDENEESSSHEANATNSILANSITRTVVDENDINSWDHEFFESKNMNCEEDRNEFFNYD